MLCFGVVVFVFYYDDIGGCRVYLFSGNECCWCWEGWVFGRSGFFIIIGDKCCVDNGVSYSV